MLRNNFITQAQHDAAVAEPLTPAQGATTDSVRNVGGYFMEEVRRTLIARYGERPIDILDRVPGTSGDQNGGGDAGGAGVLDKLGGNDAATPPATDSGTTPPATAPADPAKPAVPNGQ